MLRTALLLLALLSAAATISCGSDGNNSGDDKNYLFVISAPSGSIEGSTLTLDNVPSVIYFSDRPKRDVGHVTVDRYVNLWTPAADAPFTPPNADVAVLSEDGTTNAVVELESVHGDSTAMTFEIAVLEGELAEGKLGPVSLFVDTCDIAYPLCPPF